MDVGIHAGDDTASVIAERLRVYHAETAPLVEHYRGVGVLVDYRVRHGLGDIEELTNILRDLTKPM